MVDRDDDDLKQLIEAIARSSKRITKSKATVEKKQPPIKLIGRHELVLRLLKIQEYIMSVQSVDPRTQDDIGILLDKVTTLLERQC